MVVLRLMHKTIAPLLNSFTKNRIPFRNLHHPAGLKCVHFVLKRIDFEIKINFKVFIGDLPFLSLLVGCDRSTSE